MKIFEIGVEAECEEIQNVKIHVEQAVSSDVAIIGEVEVVWFSLIIKHVEVGSIEDVQVVVGGKRDKFIFDGKLVTSLERAQFCGYSAGGCS